MDPVCKGLLTAKKYGWHLQLVHWDGVSRYQEEHGDEEEEEEGDDLPGAGVEAVRPGVHPPDLEAAEDDKLRDHEEDED